MPESTKDKKMIKIIVTIVFAITILILIMCMCMRIIENLKSTPIQPTNTPESTPKILNDNREGFDGKYQFMTREEILESLQNNQKLVTDSVSSNITFSSGEAGEIGEWVLENTEENSVIQQAEIYFGDLLIGRTEPVYPGQFIQAVELLEDLEQGEYEVIAYISYYNLDDKVFAGQAGYKIHLTVQ